MAIIFKKLKNLFWQNIPFLTFLVVGCFTALIYFLVFAFFWHLMGINYKSSVSIAYLVAVLFHFSTNRRLTFKAHGANLFRHMIKYMAMVILNYLVTLFIMYIIVEKLNLTPYVGIVIAIATNINSNFLMSRYWVFRAAKIPTFG